jgi:aspartate/methionine/tyrosine aminotransferase
MNRQPMLDLHATTQQVHANRLAVGTDRFAADTADITQHEIRALKRTFNLADAHTHQRQSASQRNIVSDLPNLWYEAESRKQADLEQAFIESFFSLHNQHSVLKKSTGVYLTYAASISTFIAAMYLRARNMKVALIEPCFDNLHDLLKNIGVPIQTIPEDALHDDGMSYRNLIRAAGGADAVFLVDPNNPTGFSTMAKGRKGFLEVIRFCVDFNKLLLLDLSFASFALMDPSIGRFDIYEMLDESGVSYIAMEDTGKTWPLQDAKCAVLVVSDDIARDIYNLQTSVLLNVSPFLLNMVRAYVEDSRRDNFASVRDVILRSRDIVTRGLSGSMLDYCRPLVKTSVAWYRISAPHVTSTILHEDVLAHDVYVLPGKYFFWQHREQGERYLRIALAREAPIVETAVAHLRSVVDSYA